MTPVRTACSAKRCFEIIGEAVNRLARADSETTEKIDESEHIIAFRNILIHGYDLIDHAQVWKVITDQIPVLLSQVETLLARFSHDNLATKTQRH